MLDARFSLPIYLRNTWDNFLCFLFFLLTFGLCEDQGSFVLFARRLFSSLISRARDTILIMIHDVDMTSLRFTCCHLVFQLGSVTG
ncbi:hypothetical protein GALMADRAFT_1060847 [Galerina marginata CBS 339.88]|uniref:Uncharacterized protein n=1 Tax=Galerina marginata (strain CBS 339.88) TaxID=685588 RepID=A0A067SJ53_GALM3|nr:hypothetical protein GALMADRAFT_1060847 [Galerina marginata CBS 339.88]